MVLRDRLNDERAVSQEKAVIAALASAKEAVNKAEAAAEKRFESVNELRGMATDILARTVTRDVFEAAIKAIDAKIVSAVDTWDKRHLESVDRVVSLEKRQAVAIGEKTGAKDTVDNSRANIALIITAILFAVNFLQFMWNFFPHTPIVQEVIPAVKTITP